MVKKEVKNSERFPIIMIGNKLDLEENRQIQTQQAIRIAKTMEVSGYIECSAKTGKNVDEIFKSIVQKILNFEQLIIT